MINKKELSNLKEKDIFVASIDIGTNSTHLLIAEINLNCRFLFCILPIVYFITLNNLTRIK